MKKFLFVLGLISSTAIACPDLAGHFHCKGAKGLPAQEIFVTQSVKDGITSYNLKTLENGKTSNMTHIADSKIRPAVLPEYSTRTTKASCMGTALNVEIEGNRKGSDQTRKMLMSISLNVKRNLEIKNSGTEGTRIIEAEILCVRK